MITSWEYTVVRDEFGNVEETYLMPVRGYRYTRGQEILDAVQSVAEEMPEIVGYDMDYIEDGWNPYVDPADGSLYAEVRRRIAWAEPEEVADAVGYFLTEVAA